MEVKGSPMVPEKVSAANSFLLRLSYAFGQLSRGDKTVKLFFVGLEKGEVQEIP